MPAPVQCPVGTRFARLVVIGEAAPYPNGDKRWLCRCDCGMEKAIAMSSLRKGLTRSCGCHNREVHTTHGRTRAAAPRNRTYKAWETMKQRCLNPKNAKYPSYGGAGIGVCERWLTFDNFLADMGEAPSNEHSIDRIDGSRGYAPDNCRWATRKEQQRNLKTNRRVTMGSQLVSFRDACDRVGISYDLAQLRIKRGWTTEEAIFTPKGSSSRVRSWAPPT